MADSVIRDKGEGRAFWMLGGLYECRVSSDETGGAITVMEMTIPEGAGPPPLSHTQQETVYVIEGTARYHIGGETQDVGPGAIINLPAGTVETFEPTSTVRLLMTYAPGGIEHFFAEAGEEATERRVPPPLDGPPDVERLAAIGAKYGLQLQAPS